MDLNGFEPCFKIALGAGLERVDDSINATSPSGDWHLGLRRLGGNCAK